MIRSYLHATLILLLSISGFAQAETNTPLLSGLNYDAIGEHTQFLIETDETLSFDEAKTAYTAGRFNDWHKPVLTFGIGARPVWLKFDIDNQTDSAELKRLSIEASWLDLVEIYFTKNQQLISHQKAGDTSAFGERPVAHRFFAFDHQYTPGTTEVYIRIETPDPMVIPIFFGDMAASSSRDVFNGYSYGMLYGLIIGLLLYNFFVYLSIKQSRYLYYVLYLSMLLTANMTYTGHAYGLFWPGSPQIQNWMPSVSITLFAITGIFFALSFLKIKELFPGLYRRTNIFCAFFCSLQILFIILNLQTLAVASAIIFVTFFSIFTLYCAIISFHRGHRDAIYYLVATIATLFGVAITALTVWAIIPYTSITYRAAEIAVSFDAILLSIALAEQIRRAHKEKSKAQQLARVDLLTNLYNRRAFNEITTPIWHSAIRHDQELCIILLDIDRFKSINDTYGHATGDQVLREISSAIENIVRDGDVLARWGGEEFAIMLPLTSLEQAITMAERIRETISEMEIIVENNIIRTTVSIGIAQKDSNIHSIDKLFTLADASLYQAKNSGRNMVCTEIS